jgi:predicted alpha-1,2-mannosidase
MQHVVYLYNYAGAPWKTQFWVREIMDRLYNAGPAGYSGDEDTGQTSAWYIFSALGFYPVAPAANQYVIGAPLFKKATIQLSNGKKIVINAPANNAERKYVSNLKVNGKAHTKNWLSHSELMKGAVLDFTMSANPNKTRGVKAEDDPLSFSPKTAK